MVHFVYILECRGGTFYVGLTNDLKRRLNQHRNGFFKGSFTKRRLPIKLVYYEKYEDRHKAALREKQVKDWRREKKINLIKKFTSSPVRDEKGP